MNKTFIPLPDKWPHAKQRPRVTKQGVAYTTKATREAEANLVAAYQATVNENVADGPLRIDIELANDGFWIEITPIEEYENRKLRGDIDNYAKTILDSLNGIAYHDDKQIGELNLRKL